MKNVGNDWESVADTQASIDSAAATIQSWVRGIISRDQFIEMVAAAPAEKADMVEEDKEDLLHSILEGMSPQLANRSYDRQSRNRDNIDRSRKKAEDDAYDEMSEVVKDAGNEFRFLSLRSTWDRDTLSATSYVSCRCNDCRERHGHRGGEFSAYCDMSVNSIQGHLVSNGVIVKCELNGELVLAKKLADYVKGMDKDIPDKARRVFWCPDHKRYFSYPHTHHCDDCHMGFASTGRMDGHTCRAVRHHKGSMKGRAKGHARGGRSAKKVVAKSKPKVQVEDFPPLVAEKPAVIEESKAVVDESKEVETTASSGGHTIFKIIGSDGSVEVCYCGQEKTVSRAVYEKMIGDKDILTKAVDSGFATGIQGKYARCWDCQCSYTGDQQQGAVEQQMAYPQHMLPPVPDGFQWCMASVPVTFMTPMGPQVFLQQKFVLMQIG